MCAARRSQKHQPNQKTKAKTAERHSCAVIIEFPHAKQAKALEKDIKTDIPNPSFSKKFDLSRKDNLLSINIHDVHDTVFSSAFLLALSMSVKELVGAANEESDLSFEFQGTDEAGAAVCVASNGLWPAKFSFSSEDEKERFNAAREVIDTEIQNLTQKALPHLKKEIEKNEGRKGKK